MLEWIFNNILLILAMGILIGSLLALALLPPRKKMMLKRIRASERRVRFAYAMSLASLSFVAVLVVSAFSFSDGFRGIIGSLFLYSNSLLLASVGFVLVIETRWVSNFSQELRVEGNTKVEIVGRPAAQLACPLCLHEMTIPHEYIGHVISCPSCGAEGRVRGVAL